MDEHVEIAVRRRDDPEVDLAPGALAEPRRHVVLEHAEQLDLERLRRVVDLVEEHRAAGGRADQSVVIGNRAGERAADVTEQLAFDQLVRDRGAVDRHEPAAPARARVEVARGEILAGAGLAGQQHGH